MASTSKPCPCLVRVTDGHKLKFSTLIGPTDDEFIARYTAVIKTNMAPTMKQKTKRKKQPTSAGVQILAHKPKGSARGSGHAARQRLIKARSKAIQRLLKRRTAAPQRTTA